MINKESFVKIMDSLRDYSDALDIMYDKLGLNMDDNVFTKHLDNVMNALCEDVEDEIDDEFGPLLYYYAFECDWGRNEKAAHGMPAFGEDRVPITSAERLYEYLLFQNAMDNYTRNTTHGGIWIDEDGFPVE